MSFWLRANKENNRRACGNTVMGRRPTFIAKMKIKAIPYIITMLRMCGNFLRERTFFIVAQTLKYFRI